MGPISLDISIDAPRERVFDLISDLGRRLAWTDHFVSDFRLAREEPAGEGAAARFRVDAPGGIRYLDTSLTSVSSPHRIVEEGHGGRFNRVAAQAVWELEGGAGSPTHVTLTFGTEPATALDRVRQLRASGWWRRRWKRALHRLRDLLEASDSEVEPVRLAGIDSRPS